MTDPAPHKLRLGAHMSIAGGFVRAIEHARRAQATALQIFLKNSNQWQARPIAPEEAAEFRQAAAQAGLTPVVAHSSYLINLASPDPALGERSVAAMIDELARAAALGVDGVVLHPGAHMGQGEAAGLKLVAERLNRILAAAAGPAGVILETTAGQGTCLGHDFDHLARIMERVEDQTRVGACLDTCHAFSAGYDLATPDDVRQTLDAFDRTVGLGRLRVIHLNDSKTPRGARRDRHEHLGQGQIGAAGLAALLREPRLAGIRFILETPKGPVRGGESGGPEDQMNLETARRWALGASIELPPSPAEPPLTLIK